MLSYILLFIERIKCSPSKLVNSSIYAKIKKFWAKFIDRLIFWVSLFWSLN